jgi:diketogulonate reductase-like aldo/keto reductase
MVRAVRYSPLGGLGAGLLRDPTLARIGAAHGCSAAAVAAGLDQHTTQQRSLTATSFDQTNDQSNKQQTNKRASQRDLIIGNDRVVLGSQ